MNKIKNILLLLVLLYCSRSYSQQVVSVDKSTGAALVNVPLWTMQEGSLRSPVAVYYQHGDGVPVGATDGILGVGWGLSADGMISRELRGLPDDYDGTDGDERKGWLSSLGTRLVSDFISNLYLGTDELTPWNVLNSLYGSNGEDLILDTEPDIFTISAPGIWGRFVFDETGVPRPVPYADYQIEYRSSSTGEIQRFIITTTNGTKYFFNKAITNTRVANNADPAEPVTFFTRDYSYYKSPVRYTTEWKLTKMEAYTGEYILYSYTDGATIVNESEITVLMRDAVGAENYTEKPVYTLTDTYRSTELARISNRSGQRVDFHIDEDSERIEEIEITDSRKKGTPYVKSYFFSYTTKESQLDEGNYRYALESIQEQSGCDQLPPYRFAYDGLEYLPDEDSNAQDYWGYFNGRRENRHLFPKVDIYPNELQSSDQLHYHRDVTPAGKVKYTLDGADRQPDAAHTATGILHKVIMPLGDIVHIRYEPNTYYDEFLKKEVTGPGVRVKQMHRYDQRLSSNIISENIHYYYTGDLADLSGGQTSGRLLFEPKFTIPTSSYNNGDITLPYALLSGSSYTDKQKWEYLTPRTDENIGQQDQGILYSSIISAIEGEQGFIQTLSTLPPGEHHKDEIWEDWSMPTVAIARNNQADCQQLGEITGGANTYPYINNSSALAESTLFSNEIVYDGALHKLSENTETYARQLKDGHRKIRALYFEEIPNSCDESTYLFGTYEIAYGSTYLMDERSEITYDTDGQHPMTTTVDYTYGASGHGLPTVVETTDPAGNTFRTETIYAVDYEIHGAPVETPEHGIENLIYTGRALTPVETISSQKLVGASDYSVTAARYTAFREINGKSVGGSSKRLSTATPIDDFQKSSVTAGSLKPDHRYETVSVIDRYDDWYRPLSVYTPVTKRRTSTLWSATLHAPVVSISQALPEEVFFTDFSSIFDQSYIAVEPGSVRESYGQGLNDDQSLELSSSRVAIQGEFSKRENDYIFSFWTNSPFDQSLILNLKNTESGTVIQTYTIPFEGADQWTYQEQKIALTGLDETVYFEIEKGPTSHPLQGYHIDNVAIYPEISNLVASSYEVPYGVSSTIGNHGYFMINEYDGLGRISARRDSEGNLRQVQDYRFGSLSGFEWNIPHIYTENNEPVYEGVETRFFTDEYCIDNFTYEWAILKEDVTVSESDYQSTGTSITHTFSTSGERHTVHIRISHPDYGIKLFQKTFEVEQRTLLVSACTKGKLSVDLCGQLQTIPLDCPEITEVPSNALEVFFKVHQVTAGDGHYTYQWQRKTITDQVSSWTDLPYTTNTISQCTHDSYEIRCVVTDGAGRVGHSQTFSIIRYKKDPSCQVTIPACNN